MAGREAATVKINITDATDKLRRIHAHCKRLSDKNGLTVKKEFRQALRKAARPTVLWQRRWVLRVKGVPTEWRKESSRRTNIAASLSGKKAGVMIRLPESKSGTPSGKYINKGKWRRPRRAHRDRPWIEQRVMPGWFDRPPRANQKKFSAAVLAVVDDLIRDFKIE